MAGVGRYDEFVRRLPMETNWLVPLRCRSSDFVRWAQDYAAFNMRGWFFDLGDEAFLSPGDRWFEHGSDDGAFTLTLPMTYFPAERPVGGDGWRSFPALVKIVVLPLGDNRCQVRVLAVGTVRGLSEHELAPQDWGPPQEPMDLRIAAVTLALGLFAHIARTWPESRDAIGRCLDWIEPRLPCRLDDDGEIPEQFQWLVNPPEEFAWMINLVGALLGSFEDARSAADSVPETLLG